MESREDPTRGAQVTIRCPSCDNLYQPFPPFRTDKRICSFCGHEIAVYNLVRGRDGVYGVKPDPPPSSWRHNLMLVYPDGSTSEMHLGLGIEIRPGDTLPGTTLVVDRFEFTDTPVEGGRFSVVGILREP